MVNPINLASLKFSGHFLVLKAYLEGENHIYDYEADTVWKKTDTYFSEMIVTMKTRRKTDLRFFLMYLRAQHNYISLD